MSPTLVLEEPYLQVEPGAEVRTRLRVRNGGSTVERYRLEVVGDPARWAQVEPRHLAVPPGDDRAVEVVFRPPHAAAAPTVELAFAVRVRAVDHRDRGGPGDAGAGDAQDAAAEGTVRVTAVPDLAASIEPPAAAGRWGAGYRVRFSHAGRAPVALRVVAGDMPRALRYAVAPAQVAVAPGADVDVLVSVRPRGPRLVGAPVRHTFAVDHRTDAATSAGRVTAVFEQRAVLPTAVAATLSVAAAALLAGAFLVTVRSAGSAAPPAAAGPTAAAASVPGPAGVDPVRGFVALYGPPTPVDDAVGGGSAERFLARLQAAGVDARIVDSRDSAQLDDGPRGLIAVLRDGFPDRAAAQSECAARRAVAPDCVVLAPRG